MATLARILRSFQDGTLSREELFAEVDQILDVGKADETFLLETLQEENTKVPLPDDVHRQVREKIETAAQKKKELAGTADTDRGDIDPDQSRTRLATSLYFDGPPSGGGGGGGHENSSPSMSPALNALRMAAPEPMKHTGDVLNDRFVLKECIGTGGMSSVYRALDRRKLEADDRNPYVAVKVLNVEFRAHPDSLIALQREAKKSQSLAHPNIVRVYDFDRDGSTVYMTMEYLPGKSLAKVLRAPGFKGLPENEAMDILEKVARALRFAHENGIVHADFKPANVILADDGNIKVIDFGIARAFQRPEDTDMEATRFDPGSLGALTPTYASPEMLEHQEPDPRDDVYALACIVYEMLTGRHPFGRMQATEARDGGLTLERRNLSRRQWRALKSALEFDRGKRTPSIVQFLGDLRSQNVITIPAPVYTMSKVAAAAVVGVLIYHYVDFDFMQRGESNLPVVAVPADTTDKKGDAELASLEMPAAEADNGSTDAAVFTKVEDTPAVKADEPVEVVSMLDRDVVAGGATPQPKLSETAVAELLNDMDCAALNPSLKEGGTLNLRGYVSKSLDARKLENDLLALPGAKSVNLDLVTVDTAKCAVVDALSPYWAAGRGDGQEGVSIKTRNPDNEFTEGDPLVVEIATPPYETYVNVDYFSLDGNVVHLVPGPRLAANQAPASYRAVIGELGEWRIAEPFGTEMVTVVVTPEPLFKDLREEYEPGKDYLAAMGQRLRQIAADAGNKKVAVDMVLIDTKPKSVLQRLRDSALSE